MLETASDRRSAKRRLAVLQRTYGLPAGCTLDETFLERVVVGRRELFMCGLLASTGPDAEVTGSAAQSSGYPVDRAYFELVERLSVLLARARSTPLPVRDHQGKPRGTRKVAAVFSPDRRPERVRRSLSNGVALHRSWSQACSAATCELIERDRVLRSFRGEFAPKRLRSHDARLARDLSEHYAVQAYEFEPAGARYAHQVCGLFLFPRHASAPLSYGFAAAPEREAALAAASGEALQRLAFLWGESIPSAPPALAPTPDFHQEHYLYPGHHALLQRWLAGGVAARTPRAAPLFDGDDARLVDLTPPGMRELVVAKAHRRGLIPLRFGADPTRSRPHPIA